MFEKSKRKVIEKTKEEFDAVIAPLLEAGEQPVAGTRAKPGTMVGGMAISVSPLHWYYLAVTDRRVLFVRQLGKRLDWADPLDSVQIHGVHWGRVISKFEYRRPNGEHITMNVEQIWRGEAQAVVAALTSHSQQPQAPQPQAVVNGARSPADWHPDPLKRHEYRYWDGTRWTENVSDAGAQSVDPTDTQAAAPA